MICSKCGREIVHGFICQECRDREKGKAFITLASFARRQDINIKNATRAVHSIAEYRRG